MTDRYFGAHTIDTGGIHMAARRAARSGMRAMQLFSAVPKYYNEKVTVKPDRAARFAKALAEGGIDRRHVLVHAGYVLNTASAEPEKAQRAATALAKELERTTTLGAMGCCFHPGSAGSSDPVEACARVGAAITHALSAVPDGARVLVENTAGAGRTMGRAPQEIAEMLRHVPKALRARTGYGLDTCHLFASGHDITASEQSLRDVLDVFTDTIGEPPSFFHLNDSEGAFGSNRDRHTLIGEGQIGIEPFRWLVRDRRAVGIPLILETPQERMDIAEDDDAPDPWDVRMIRLLESFLD